MKAFKFLFIFFLVTVGIFALVIWPNKTAFIAVFSDPESFSEGSEWVEKTYSLAGLVEYMEAQPHVVSVVSLNLNNPEENILFNADEPRVMGAISNIFLVMEYARQVESGEISPGDRVSVDDINRFTVPTWYRSGHRTAMSKLNPENGTVALEDVVRIITRHYSQAASDWMFFHLGPDRVNALIDSLGSGQVSPWVPGSGIQVSVILRDADQSKSEKVGSLLAKPAHERNELFIKTARQYFEDDEMRNRVSDRAGRLSDRLLAEERSIHRLWPMAEPIRVAEIMADIYHAAQEGDPIARMVYEPMTWAYEEAVVRTHTDDYAALFESRLGFLNGLDMGTSTYTKDSYVQLVTFSDLPIQMYMHMSSNFMNQDFQRRLIYDPGAREMTKRASRQELTPAE